MGHADMYTEGLLTIIAVLLAFNALDRFRVPTGSGPSRYTVEPLILPIDSNSPKWDERTLATVIGTAAKGRELVTVLQSPSAGQLLAVYKQGT